MKLNFPLSFRNALLVSLTVTAMSASAQHLWTEAEFSTKLPYKIGINASLDYRTSDGLKATDDWRIGIGLDYKICPWLKAAAAYTFIDSREPLRITAKGNIIPSYYQPKSRFSFSLTGSYSFGRFKLSLRERYQYTYRYWQYAEKYDSSGNRLSDEYISSKATHYLRSRLEMEYNIRKCPFTPYASIELYNSLSHKFDLDRTRYTLGGDYKINRHNSVGLYYMFIDRNKGQSNSNVIGLSYQFKL